MKLSKGMFRKVSLNENNNNVSNDKEYCYSLERIVELLLGKTSDEEDPVEFVFKVRLAYKSENCYFAFQIHQERCFAENEVILTIQDKTEFVKRVKQ